MKRFFSKTMLGMSAICVVAVLILSAVPSSAENQVPEAVLVKDPNGISVNVFAKPEPGADVMTIVVHGNKLEVIGRVGAYLEVKIPDREQPGYVLESETEPTDLLEESGSASLLLSSP